MFHCQQLARSCLYHILLLFLLYLYHRIVRHRQYLSYKIHLLFIFFYLIIKAKTAPIKAPITVVHAQLITVLLSCLKSSLGSVSILSKRVSILSTFSFTAVVFNAMTSTAVVSLFRSLTSVFISPIDL